MNSKISVFALLVCLLATSCCAAFTVGYLSTFDKTTRGAEASYIATQTYTGLAAAFNELNTADPSLGLTLIWEECDPTSPVLNFSTAGAAEIQKLIDVRNAQLIMATFFATTQLTKIAYPRGIPTVGTSTVNNDQLYSVAAQPHAVNWRFPFNAEIVQMLNYGLRSDVRCHRWGLVQYASDVEDSGVTHMRNLLEEKGMSLKVITMPTDPTDLGQFFAFAAEFDGTDSTRPQCYCGLGGAEVVIVAVAAAKFRLSAEVFGSTYFFGTSLAAIPNVYKTDTLTHEDFRNVFIVTQFPHPDDTTFNAIKRYQAAVKGFTVPTPFNNAIDTTFNIFSTEGYLIGRFIGEIVKRMGSSVSAANFVPTVYDSKIVHIDDINLGIFNNGCTGREGDLDIPCNCNIGAKSMYTTRLSATDGSFLPILDDASKGERAVAYYAVPLSVCDPTGGSDAFQRSYIFLVVTPSGAALSPFQEELRRHFVRTRYLTSLRDASVDFVTITDALSEASLTKLKNRYDPMAVVGDVGGTTDASLATLLEGSPFPFLNYIKMDPTATEPHTMALTDAEQLPQPFNETSHLSLDPVLADYIHAIAQHISKQGGGTEVHVIAYSDAAGELFKKSAAVFALGVASVGKQLPSSFSANSWYAVIAQDSAVIVEAVKLFGATPASNLAIAASEVLLDAAMSSTEVQSALTGATTANSVVFGSVLEAWWSPKPTSGSLLDHYHTIHKTAPATFTPNATSMLALRTVTLLQALTSKISGYKMKEVYSVATVAAYNNQIGPFIGSSCATVAGDGNVPTSPTRECECGKGPRRFHVHSMVDWAKRTDTTAPLSSFAQTTCGVNYKVEDNSESLPVAIIASMSAVAGLLLVAVSVTLVLLSTKKVKDNKNAPKDGSKPFAIAFTDIQSSTALWARVPVEMSEAVERHHEEIRVLIEQAGGYEVKTIGDSFMVAFADVDKAVNFATTLQTRFLEIDWGTNGIDDTYVALQEEALAAAEEEGNGATPKAVPYTEVDTRLWNGIRVRVGVHFGEGDIKLDEVSRGYDYYGTVVNTAARVESVGHGGQVLISEDVLKNMTDTSAYSVLNLGSQPLRGLDEKVTLHQVLPQNLAARKFPPLRLDVDIGSDQDSGTGSVLDDDARSSYSLLSGANLTTDVFLEHAAHRWNAFPDKIATIQLQRHFDFLSTTISPATKEIKYNTIAHLAQRWRVTIPNIESLEKAAKHDLLLAGITAKVAIVHHMKQSKTERDGGFLSGEKGSMVGSGDGLDQRLSVVEDHSVVATEPQHDN